MFVKYIKNFNGAPVVSFNDEGMMRGLIISKESVFGYRIGDSFELSTTELDTGTEYGIDINFLLQDDFVISREQIQNALRTHGIWTYEEYITQRPAVQACLQTMTSSLVRHLDTHMKQLK